MSSAVILDASALLATINRETGGDKVEEVLLDSSLRVLMSTLNWSEVFDHLLRRGMLEADVDTLLSGMDIELVDFTREQSKVAARFRLSAPSLSLADRACLGLAAMLQAKVWTADPQWMTANLPISVQLIR